MSSVTTLLQNPTTPSFPSTSSSTCRKCGADLSHSHSVITEDAQKRITELETQVRILTGKATAAVLHLNPHDPLAAKRNLLLPHLLMNYIVDKLADYEDELRQLKSSSINEQNLGIPPQSPSRPSSAPGSHPSRNNLPSRLSNLLPSSRRAAFQLPDPPLTPGHLPSNSADLLTLLTKEQTLRQEAESRVSQTNDEIEELSAQLFTEANEMVATERKARAKLEERVAILEGRDKEKRNRLEMLESRLGRIERVRGLLSGELGS